MKNKITVQLNSNRAVEADVDFPDECSSCGRLIIFLPRGNVFIEQQNELQVVIKCTNNACGRYMLLWFDASDIKLPILVKAEPPRLPVIKYSEEITIISPNFVEIYGEACEAKERNLIQIAGPGFRKAFEFLIKDYAKSISAVDNHGNIEKTFAGNVVDQYISDPRIQAVAKRALWLGNDETHYLRAWKGQNIEDLINLIHLTISWIEIEYRSKSYIDAMPR